MKRFLLFAWVGTINRDAGDIGGWDDFKSSHETYEEAISASFVELNSEPVAHFQIVDLDQLQIVRKS